MFSAYILKSLVSGQYYVGSCDNIDDRLSQHNDGRVKSTKAFAPWKVVYREEFNTRKKATNREKQIKSWKSRTAIEKLIAKHF